MVGAVILVAVLAVTAAIAVAYSRRNGRIRPQGGHDVPTGTDAPAGAENPVPAVDQISAADSALADLVPLSDARVTMVQFSTSFCSPCRATKRILSDIARVVPGVVHLEIDAESHLEAVRALDIRRTPTTLILDGDRRVVGRASGQPRRDEVMATLGRILEPTA